MKTTSIRAKALACALLAGTACCGLTAAPASAQTAPTYRNLDSNGVDLVKGDFLTSFAEGSIGSGDSELALLRMLGAIGGFGARGSSQWDHIVFQMSPGGNSVTFNTRRDLFPAAESRGASLTGSGAQYFYRSPDGTRIEFTDPSPGNDPLYCDGIRTDCLLLPTNITSPDGKTVTINYEFYVRCVSPGGPDSTVCQNVARIASVANSFGYEIRFAYAAGTGGTGPVSPDFHKRTGASFYNNAAGSSPLASVSYSYPSAGVTDVTDQGGRVWRVTSGSTSYAIRRPGASSDTLSASLSGGVVTSVTNEGVTTNYSRSVSGSIATMTVTNALSQSSTIVSDLTIGRPTSVTDPLSHTTSFTYDSSGRPKRTTAHEGNYVEHSYDARGNVTQTVAVPKGGSGPTILTSASYDSTCSNPVTCNQPNSATDARGNVTDYTYDSTHGGVLTVTAPAVGGVRPQTRYSYALTNGEYRVTGTSQCQTGSSCVGTADEVKTALAYDANGNLYWTASGNGSATLVAETAMTYDALGNLVTVDGPLPGTADTSRTRYNSARQVIGSISPDPDGGGALKHRAVRNTYDSSTGLLTKVEQGNVNSQSDSDWAAFSPAQAVETVYDSNARPIVGKLTSGSTVYALSQTSYDALGRPECSAQRMNPAVFGTVTSTSACTLGTQGTGSGDYGPDRISKAFYDAAGRAYKTRTALGTADEADESILTFTANGQIETAADGENNKTTYEYDGHDRLSKTYYPMPTKGAGASNASDYEQSTYESLAGGTRTSPLAASFRNRAGETTAFGYDALGRPVSKDRPGSEPDVAYGYDLLGRMTGASQTGNSLTFTYDALGRQLTETRSFGSYSSQYDIAGRRTRLTHPDGFYVDQDYLVTGEMVAIRENGAASGVGVLATFGYDDLGRRTSLTYGNGEVTSYQYDAMSRLSQLGLDLSGTTNDLTVTFGYNPASQIASNVRSNDLYAWTGHGSGTTSTTTNGLNQLASWNATLAYDTKGNTTSDGTRSYGYDSGNQLTGLPGGSLFYDPLGRMSGAGVSSPAILYDTEGADAVAERNPTSGVVGRRHVFGPGSDEPLVWYEGSGTSDRRFLHADEHGSIVAVTSAAGALLAINRYDEYGKPDTTNGSYMARFLYTGQRYLSSPEIYYYKARMYDPRLGRFLQTDPIGYGDGMNMYAYVGGDPVNLGDPTGTLGECPGTLIASICGDAADGVARQAIQASEMGSWSPGGQDAAAKIIVDYLLGKRSLDSVANVLYGTRSSEALIGSTVGLSAKFTLAGGYAGQAGTSISNIARDSQGFSYVGSAIVSPGQPGVSFNVLAQTYELRITTSTSNFVAPQRDRGPWVPIPFGSVTVGVGTETWNSQGQRDISVVTFHPQTTRIGIGFNLYGTRVTVIPTISTPRHTTVTIWGK